MQHVGEMQIIDRAIVLYIRHINVNPARGCQAGGDPGQHFTGQQDVFENMVDQNQVEAELCGEALPYIIKLGPRAPGCKLPVLGSSFPGWSGTSGGIGCLLIV